MINAIPLSINLCSDKKPTDIEKEKLRQANQRYLGTIITAQQSGEGCLPKQLGLTKHEFNKLQKQFLVNAKAQAICPKTFAESSEIRQELIDLRLDEWQDLVNLLLDNARGLDESENWIAKIIASACMGNDHLWRALGLTSRESLRELITNNFPELATKNSNNMRWKKFFYRQLCEQGGHFICRSPSCDNCPTFEECFGDEL